MMSTAERVDMTLGCSDVKKSSALHALRSQMGACATVVVTGYGVASVNNVVVGTTRITHLRLVELWERRQS